jgi:hypothetical protein
VKRSVVILSVMLLLTIVHPPTANADDCDGSGSTGVDFIDVGVVCQQPGGDEPGTTTPVGDDGSPDPYVRYRWASICTPDPMTPPASVDCVASTTCERLNQRRWQLWGQLENGSWRVIRSQCFGGTPPEYQPPQVTPEMVLSALRRVGLPELTTIIQPSDKTLVNFDTIFYTDPQPVSLQLTILGQGVEVEANPTTYHWVFGDGTEITTESPGAPYPSKDVLHRYADADVTVQPHVEAVYSARFRVSGGPWQEIQETVTTVGPPTELRVVEGTPLLASTRR